MNGSDSSVYAAKVGVLVTRERLQSGCVGMEYFGPNPTIIRGLAYCRDIAQRSTAQPKNH
ncbi:MAG TPA: hypothetical protein VIV60_10665 [Polyangiaceae bacterium]